MNNVMQFPETVEEFMEDYKMVDTEQVYSNGTEYVPIFRMKQWFQAHKDIPARHGEWIDMGDFEQCSACSGTRLKEFNTVYGKAIWIKTAFCPNCGAKMGEEENEAKIY